MSARSKEIQAVGIDEPQIAGSPDEALLALELALRTDPSAEWPYFRRGEILAQLGRKVEAAESYRQAVARRPTWALAHSVLGGTLEELGEYEDAVAHYRAALRLERNFTGAMNGLAIALKNCGQLEEAETWYRRLIDIDPE